MKTLKTSWIVQRGEEVCALSNHLHDVNIPVNYRSFTALLSQVTPPLHHPPHGSSAQLSPDERQLFICYVWYTCLLGFSLFVLPTFSLKTQQSCHESDEILPSAVATCWSPGARSKPGNHGGQRKKLNAMRSNPASQTRSNHTTCRSDYKRNHCSTTFQHQRRSYDQTGRQNSAPGAKFESKVMTERDLTTLKCEFKMLNSSQIIVGTR